MINPLWLSSLSVLNVLQHFLGNEKGANAPADFREQLMTRFSEFERRAHAMGCEKNKIDEAKYAIAALADECVMHSVWKEKLSWMRCSLQLQFFGEHSAGEGFFTRLSRLRQQGIAEVDVLEIYFLCLSLGFQGIYRFKDKVQWESCITSLENQIVLLRGKPEWNLSSAQEAGELLHEKTREIPLWWIAVVTVGILFFICVVYNIATQFQLQHAVNRLNAGLSYVS